MTDIMERLASGLAGRYAIERELGAGGMATVYLATDLRHGRRVAVKVLRPELGALMGPERFLREIEVAARLNHPNILALFDSGEVGGLLFYVMPYVEGESLADRLQRETQLPLDEALAITRQVADALGYAHSLGVVHRDIKPANILLSSGHALVADFGIARAVGSVDSGELTRTGIALGTPLYMSPEQAAASGPLDGRSDIYSLGCVLYEMLIGEPPFGGPTPMVVMARHSLERVPSMRAARDTIPDALEWAVHKALAKAPADRFATTTKFAEALTGPVAGARPSIERAPAGPVLGRRWRAAAVGTAALALAAVLLVSRLGIGRGRGTALDSNAVAVLPFRVAGPRDSLAQRLAGTLSDLLAERLVVDGGRRAVHSGTVAAALRRVAPGEPSDLAEADAMRVAREAGAGKAVLGQLLRAEGRLVLSASLRAVPGGAELVRVENIVGPSDSAAALVDRVAAELLVRDAGEPSERFVALERVGLPALRAYLAGQAAYARGAYGAAAQQFLNALDLDSSFALAALGLAETGRISPFIASRDVFRGDERAWQLRHELGPRDQEYVTVLLGRGYRLSVSQAEQLRAWGSVVPHMPERAAAWYQLGEALFHGGPWIGLADSRERAAAAFRQALEIKPNFAPALGHLLDIAASSGDTATVREVGVRYLAIDTAGELADYFRWRIAVALGDSAALRRIRAGFDRLGERALVRIIAIAQLDGIALDDARRAATALERRSGGALEARTAYLKRRELALNGGRPAEAAAITRAFRLSGGTHPQDRLSDVVEALMWGADTGIAAQHVRDRARLADAARAEPPAPDTTFYEVCAVNLWRVEHGQLTAVPDAITRLRRVAAAEGDSLGLQEHGLCAAVLEAKLATALHRPDAMLAARRLDSLARVGPTALTWFVALANLTAAQLLESHGDLDGALAAVRRRRYVTDFEPRVLVALSTQLREEGRLAALTGDRAGAIRAYRGYLALRTDPEPTVRPEVEGVRREVERLLSQR